MRACLVAVVLFVPQLAQAGDVWMVLQQEDAKGELRVELPAGWMATNTEALPAFRGNKPVDLRVEVAALQARREGAKADLTVRGDDGEVLPLTLHHRARLNKPAANHIEVSFGPSFAASAPLDVGGGPAAFGITGSDLAVGGAFNVDGLDFGDEELRLALRHARPTKLIEIIDRQGQGVTIQTLK